MDIVLSNYDAKSAVFKISDVQNLLKTFFSNKNIYYIPNTTDTAVISIFRNENPNLTDFLKIIGVQN